MAECRLLSRFLIKHCFIFVLLGGKECSFWWQCVFFNFHGTIIFLVPGKLGDPEYQVYSM